MQHKSIRIIIDNGVFNCRVLGNGDKNIIAFHGFGQDGNAYLPLAKRNAQFTIYSFDLPFHGNTKINNPSRYNSIDEIQEIIQKLVDQAELKRFSLLGFSMGAKFCFPILEKYYTNIDNLWLLAPDGIKTNLWYKIATSNQILRAVFRFVMNNPNMLLRTGRLMKFMSLIDTQRMILVEKSINTPEKRHMVFDTWTYLKNLNWNSSQLKSIINKSNINVFFIVGEHDHVIPKREIEIMNHNITNSRVITLASGHQNLIKKFSEMRLEDLKN